ncbi:MAG: hypothetical protein SO119_07775 [Phascolarctobacterium sp.]|nr:hypothetical protein [Phascolarctobacterium sp.]
MMLKKITGVACGMLLVVNTAMAQVTTVDGMGIDRDSAVRDAMRNAVEKVIGTFIDSRTLVDKSVIALDEIYAKSQGFVKNIKILREVKSGGEYRLTAQIDVDTNPDSQLMDRLNMIMLLNDPRISVVVEYHNNNINNDQTRKYPLLCEAFMNDKLISLGFKHVVDSSSIRNEEGIINYKNTETDYMVLGLLDIDTKDIRLPSYASYTKEGDYDGSVETGLIRSAAELDVKVMKTDTQEIIGVFRVEADSIKNTQNSVENQSIKALGTQAAEKLRKIFAQKASDVSQGYQVVVRTEKYDNVLKLQRELSQLSGIKSAFIKSYENGKAIIDVDSDFKPQHIYRLLKENTKHNLFLERTTANVVEISMS